MTANQHTPALYTAAEGAAIPKVKKRWLEGQAAARKIPFTMLGGTYRFTGGHLAAIVQMHEMMPSPSGRAEGNRSRSRRVSRSAPPMGNGVAALRPRPCRHRSDAKCYDAHAPDRDCICGGRSHGAGQRAIGNETPRASLRRTL